MSFSAGYTSLQAKDPDGAIACSLWYPTEAPSHVSKHGVYDFDVAKNAEPATGPFSLVVMSHGSGGTRFGHCRTAEVLARHGYIVLAPEHPKNNFFDDSGTGTAESYQNRSRHLKAALDKILGDAKWGPLVNAEKIAVFGFSLGGYTALCSVGATPNVKALRHHIRANREFDPLFSSYEVIVKSGYHEDILPVEHDTRYKACIALAPVSGGLFLGDALKNISVPVLLYRAERDMLLRHPFHADEIRQNLPKGCDYHVTAKAGHFSYLSPVREDARAELGEMANDAPGFDRATELDKIDTQILSFLNKALS